MSYTLYIDKERWEEKETNYVHWAESKLSDIKSKILTQIINIAYYIEKILID